jgi:hypothetical protein
MSKCQLKVENVSGGCISVIDPNCYIIIVPIHKLQRKNSVVYADPGAQCY